MKGLSPELVPEIAQLLNRPQTEPGSCADLKRQQAQQLQLEALALLVDADEGEHLDALCAAADAALQVLEQAQEEEKRREGPVKPAITAERKAEDRWRAAVEYHRQKVAAERATAGKGTPQEQAGALKDVEMAAVVVQREQAGAEGAKAARLQAEVDLEAARQAVAEATRAYDAASSRCDNPGRTPLYHACMHAPLLVLALAGKLGLTKMERMLCATALAPAAHVSGHDDGIRAEAREKAHAEAEEEFAKRPVLAPGSNPGSMTVLPPGSLKPGGVPQGVQGHAPRGPGGSAPVVSPASPWQTMPGVYVNPGAV